MDYLELRSKAVYSKILLNVRLEHMPNGCILDSLFKEKIMFKQRSLQIRKVKLILWTRQLGQFLYHLSDLTVKEKGYKRDISVSEGSLNVHKGTRKICLKPLIKTIERMSPLLLFNNHVCDASA